MYAIVDYACCKSGIHISYRHVAYDPDAHVYDVAEIDVEKLVFIQIVL